MSNAGPRSFPSTGFRYWLPGLAAVIWATAGASVAAPLGLYQWMRTAPVVVAVRPAEQSGKLLRAEVTRVVRGDVDGGDAIDIEIRKANRDRRPSQERLRLEPSRTYLVLLRESPTKRDSRRRFALVRGVEGAREVPAEGGSAFLDSVERLARIQASGDHAQEWLALGQMLEETHPLLLETALEQFIRFRRGSQETVPALRPLMDHPRPGIRELALRLVGAILERHPLDDLPESTALSSEIIARARRDPQATVRVAATEALGRIADGGVEDVLREISREDPEQGVRFAAERILYERRARETGLAHPR